MLVCAAGSGAILGKLDMLVQPMRTPEGWETVYERPLRFVFKAVLPP